MMHAASAPDSAIDGAGVPASQHLFSPDPGINDTHNSINASPHTINFHEATNPYETQPAYNPSYVPIENESPQLYHQTIKIGSKYPGDDARKRRIKCFTVIGTIFCAIILISVVIYFGTRQTETLTDINQNLKETRADFHLTKNDRTLNEEIKEMLGKMRKSLEDKDGGKDTKKPYHNRDYYVDAGEIPIEYDDWP